MKALKYSIFCLFLGLALVSCKQEPEIWDSATLEYSGRFVFGFYAEDGETEYVPITDGNEIMIYNTAANIANEIWLDGGNDYFEVKGKCTLSGTSTSFTTATDAVNPSNGIYTINWTSIPNPTAANQTLACLNAYTSFSIMEGRITPKGTTTPAGNPSDEIYLKINLKSDALNLVSYQTDPATWDDPAVPEFDWQIDESSVHYDSSLDEIYVIKGYRYTGLPEDI